MRVVAIGRTQYLKNTILKISKEHELVMIIHCKESSESTVSDQDFVQISSSLGSVFLETDNINSPDVTKRRIWSNRESSFS